MEECKIYIIKNSINNKVYIGQTHVSLLLRFQNHLSAARRYKGYVIGKAIRKYGESNFSIELIECCDKKDINEREIYWINKYKSTNNKFGYNVSIGGNVVRTTKSLNDNLIIKEFKDGIPAYILAKKYKVAVSRITNILKNNSIEYGITLQKTNSNEEQDIIELYNKGYSTIDIGNKYHKNKSTIKRILVRNDVKMRTFKETKNLKRNLSTLN